MSTAMTLSKEQTTDYLGMVEKLAKPGVDIVATFKPKKAHLLHMAVGVVGEMGELAAAINAVDRDNVREEIGDAYFYLAGFLQGFEANVFRINPHTQPDLFGMTWMGMIQAQIDSCAFLDKVKKLVIYNKDISQAEFVELITPLLAYLEKVMHSFEITLEECLTANMKKLLTGKNARYAAGTYSDGQAQARADKDGAE